MLYQIDSQKVEDYLVFMEDKIKEMEENILLFETNKNKLDWEGKGAEATKNTCQSLIDDEKKFCNILRIYMLIYKKGLQGYGESFEQLENEFRRMLEENDLLKEAAQYGYKY